MNWKVCLALVAGFALGFLAAVAAQNLLDAMNRSFAKRNAGECRTISNALEAYRRDHGRYPPIDGDITHAATYLVPDYLRAVPQGPYLVVMNGPHAAVIWLGRYGAMAQAGQLRGGVK